jgi:hypothetical protein
MYAFHLEELLSAMFSMVLAYVFFLNGDQLNGQLICIRLTIPRSIKTVTKPLTNEGGVLLNMSTVT